MIVSGLPVWIVVIIAVFITLVYYLRNRKGWMSHWLVILAIFAGHFFFFAWGVMFFLLGEIIRAKSNKRAREKYSK